jgi:crossover junction endodeoxyribonuclease RuvC
MIVLGIDPGLNGAYAVLGKTVVAEPMPTTPGEIDIYQLSSIIFEHEPDLVMIEWAQSMPKQGVASTFKYGKGFGMILGMLETLHISHQLVRPRAWKADVLAGTKKDKVAAISYVRRKYPGVDLLPGKRRKPHDGMADAVCIAEYGLRVLGDQSSNWRDYSPLPIVEA